MLVFSASGNHGRFRVSLVVVRLKGTLSHVCPLAPETQWKPLVNDMGNEGIPDFLKAKVVDHKYYAVGETIFD